MQMELMVMIVVASHMCMVILAAITIISIVGITILLIICSISHEVGMTPFNACAILQYMQTLCGQQSHIIIGTI